MPAEVHVVDNSPRPFPLVIHQDFQAARLPRPLPRSGRRGGLIFTLLVLAGAFSGALAWYVWPVEFGAEATPAITYDETNSEKPADASGSSTPRRAAHLAAEIIPLDSGEAP
jgi:hypothetical protein